nr:MAG TPA: hypothetical protein [Caudoviricetes sp.]
MSKNICNILSAIYKLFILLECYNLPLCSDFYSRYAICWRFFGLNFLQVLQNASNPWLMYSSRVIGSPQHSHLYFYLHLIFCP